MIRAIYRKPFSLDMPSVGTFRDGQSVGQIAATLGGVPAGFGPVDGFARVNGATLDGLIWAHTIPPAGAVVEFGHHVAGGGEDGGGGKQVLSAIAAIGLTLATGGIAGGLLETAGGLFVKGSISANLLAGGVGLIGSLILNGLTPPPTLGGGADDNTDRSAGVSGNALDPNGIVPRVIGERRIAPSLLTQPLVTLSGQDEVVEAVFGLNGPHRLQNIQIGSADASTMAGVDLEAREGWPGQDRLRLFRRYGVTQSPNTELRGHLVNADKQSQLDSSVDVSTSVPQPAVFATRQSPDEHQIQIAFPQGIGRPSVAGEKLRIPFRLRLRPVGGAWVNLPELHYRAAESRLVRTTIRLVWADEGIIAPEVSNSSGWVEARTTVPGQAVAPETSGWTADSYFHDGAGDVEMWSGNLGTTGVQHVYSDKHTVTINLDPATFALGQYEVEITRGCAVREATFTRATYSTNGGVYDLFAYYGTIPTVPQTREGMADTVAILRSVSIWNSPPVNGSDFALIAVKARNVQLEELSVLAGGYVQDWSGAAWDNWTVTSNPAPHIRDIFAGRQNLDPLPVGNIDDTDMMVPFRTFCAAQGYTCNAILSGSSVAESAGVVAACGYGRPYMSEVWGVIWDRDRSADSPAQLFTPRTSRGLAINKSFDRLPDGLRITFDDADQGWVARQIMVFRPGMGADSGRTEQVRYEGIDTEAAAIARATYDLEVLAHRSATYSLDVSAEAILTRRGDLVMVSHDMLGARHGEGRVIAGGVDGVILDTAVRLVNEPEMYTPADLYAVADLYELGLQSAAAIRRADGSVDVELLDCVTGETDELIFDTATTHVDEGALIAVGPRATETMRLIVAGVMPKSDLSASLTLIDESSELFA